MSALHHKNNYDNNVADLIANVMVFIFLMEMNGNQDI